MNVDVDVEVLRRAIREEYDTVALDPGRGFHFHTGRVLAEIVGYRDKWLPRPDSITSSSARR
jgi:hypothetical protein